MSEQILYEPASAEFADNAHEIYRKLRDDFPVYRDEARGSWVLTRYQDIRAAASDGETFSSERTSISQGLRPMLQQLDGPRHDKLRKMTWGAFSPSRVAGMEGRIRAIANELMDGFADVGECDLLHAYAAQLPSRVIGELIGIPADRREAFLGWTEALIATNSAQDRQENPFEKIYAEFTELLALRRTGPADDLMSALLDTKVDGESLTEDELLGFCFLLVVGGNDTTTNLIANGSVLLARHPDQRAELVRDPSLIPGAIEEMLRYEAPTQALPRRVTREIEIHGRKLRSDEEVSLVWGSGNHDERRFPDPERFDIGRQDNRHLALGHGVHFCMGSNLARLEGRVAFETLLERLPGYALAREPQWLPSSWARAYQAVPICW
ncbi:MAG: cytochrome P450 [Deltaproteobacteria bacterium]|nr:cytochrome P450 [Deltaproteobacteria bacterium]MBW2362145.1 cytochrome P450 [Deltaproteobacteria bacterium]